MDQKSQKTKTGKVSINKVKGEKKPKKQSIKTRKRKMPSGRPQGKRVGTGKKAVTKSKKINAALLKGTKATRTKSGAKKQTNYVVYDIPASKVYDEEVKAMARLANSRLRALEKSGQKEYSREYQLVNHYANGDPNGKGSIYNVNEEKGTIRFTQSTRNMTPAERTYYVNTLRNFLNAETSTVRGTRKASQRAFSKYMENHPGVIMDLEQYQMLWKVFRENVTADKASHEGYNAFMYLMKNNQLYDLTEEQAAEAMDYINTSKQSTTIDIAAEVIDKLPFIKNEEGNIVPNPLFK